MNIGGLGIGGLNMSGFKIPSFNYTAPTIDEEAINKALEAVTVRKEANDAISNATDQYEADVADFKNTQATEIEQGIATLPEILNLSETPFVPEGIGSFTGLPRTEREIGRENELPYQETIIPSMPNEDFIPFVPPKRDEQIFIPPPSIQDLDERDFRDTIGNDYEPKSDIIPATDPVISGGGINYDDIGMPLIDPKPFIGTGGGGREDFVRDFDDTGFGDYIIEDPIIPPITPPIDSPIGNPYEDIFNLPIDIPGIYDDIGYPPFDPPFDDPIILPPYDPPYDPPEDPPITPPPPPPPIDEGPTGPINYYTGKPISNPYTPYSTDSGTAPLTRTITPRDFGQAPGFERPVGGPPILPPAPRPPIDPPIMCFVAGTKVDMADGTKKVIENIAIGDEVLALNGEADVVSYVHDIPKANRNLWTINDRITATDSHAFLTKDGWKSNNSKLSNTVYNVYGIEGKDLQIADKLITNDGVAKVTTLENEKDFVKVYNFTTANTHTYLVDGVVSHNKLPPIDFPKELRPIAMAPKGAKGGGYLNNGISMLPMNGQGDTLTTQVFQSGFRPRR